MRTTMGSRRRFYLLGGPSGYLTCVPAGSPLLRDRYARWQRLAMIRRPMTGDLVDYAQRWALRTFEVTS